MSEELDEMHTPSKKLEYVMEKSRELLVEATELRYLEVSKCNVNIKSVEKYLEDLNYKVRFEFLIKGDKFSGFIGWGRRSGDNNFRITYREEAEDNERKRKVLAECPKDIRVQFGGTLLVKFLERLVDSAVKYCRDNE